MAEHFLSDAFALAVRGQHEQADETDRFFRVALNKIEDCRTFSLLIKNGEDFLLTACVRRQDRIAFSGAFQGGKFFFYQTEIFFVSGHKLLDILSIFLGAFHNRVARKASPETSDQCARSAFRPLFFPHFTEKSLKNRAALLPKHVPCDLHLMVKGFHFQ